MSYSVTNQFAWAWSITKSYRHKIALYMLLETISIVLTLLFIYCSKQVIDVATKMIPGNLKILVIYLVLSIVSSIIVDLISSWLSESIKIELKADIQNSLAYTQMMSAWTAIKKWHTGDLLVRLNSDCSEVVQMLAYSFPFFCITCVKFLASFGFLWVMDPMLGGLFLILLPLFAFSKIYYKKMRQLSRDVKQAESYLGTVMQENLKHKLLLRALLFTKVRWDKLLNSQTSVSLLKLNQLKFFTLTQGILKLAFNGGYLLAFVWGAYRLYTGHISYGTMTAFLQLVGQIQMPVITMIAFLPAAIRCRAAIDRLMELQEEKSEVEGEELSFSSPVTLTLNNLSFSYNDNKIIEHLSATFQTGVASAIVGSTGKGKTTLIRLMLALMKPDSGTLSFIASGRDYAVSVCTRANFAYVPQGNTLFTGTIRENLLLAKPLATDEQLRGALRIACADFVYSLPMEMNTLVGESGHGLSEGQAQRIAIARALLRDATIWVFDEPTSALDATTTKQLMSNLLQAGRDKILIFVTHDSQVMEACSQVVRLS
ncbi:ABC transporter ATP-binding protein [uncultured Bacteroides sp.]|uniref:ABC transporter ATP-binding protein n=1 Tax=uncultured Bacteroides sp. TaxID=162156 RepID=UPI002AAC1E5B|nr:ABC transporter ATP-binding protein [uncultured Bacteroides sp.]